MIKNNKKIISFIQNILANILRFIDIEDSNGDKINPPHITFISIKNATVQPIYKQNNLKYTPINVVRFTEPIIIFIQEILNMISRYYDLYDVNYNKITIYGFRLKLKHWIRPCFSLPFNLRGLSSLCNCKCIYCYHKNSPMKDHYKLSFLEAKTRTKYYDVNKKRGLFNLFITTGEMFCNPYAIDILKLIREKDKESPIPIPTNGCLLNKKLIKELSKLKPILISISLNSTDPHHRRRLMGGSNHEQAINSIKQLRHENIHFIGSVIAWPSLPFKDILKSLHYLEENEAYYAVIYLPGYTKYNKIQNINKKTMTLHWQKTRIFFNKIRRNYQIPILLDPNSYWISSIKPTIDGIVKNSPADKCGIKTDDEIIAINKNNIYTRDMAIKTMNFIIGQNQKSINLTIKRDGIFYDYILKDYKTEEYYYPYKPFGYKQSYGSWGLLICNSFDTLSIQKLRDYVKKNNLKRVVLFVSPLLKKQISEFEMDINLNKYCSPCIVKIVIMRNYYWGGNIQLGDLMMVEDFCKTLASNSIRKFSPEAIIIPNTFISGWKRDFLGAPITEIKRNTGYEVYFLPCSTIYF